jgi:hypothetical protein
MSSVTVDKPPRSGGSGFITSIPTDDTLPKWRAWLVRHPIGGALLAGAVATQFATVFGVWFSGFGLPSVNWPIANGSLLLGISPATAAPPYSASVYIIGELSHFTDGVFFALLFALLFHPLVPIRNTMGGNLIKALLYGTVLAVVSAGWWVPTLYAPHHMGFLSTAFGWKLCFAIFLWHWIYGYFLGTVYCPAPKDTLAADA